MRRSTGSDAHEQALLGGDLTAHGEGILDAHGDDLVVQAGLKEARHEPRADPQQFVRPELALGHQGRALGLIGHKAQAWLALFERPGDPRHRAARPQPVDENVHPSARSLPYLLSRRLLVAASVGRVKVLLHIEGVGPACGQFPGPFPRAPDAEFSGREHQLGPQGAQQLLVLVTHHL